MKQSKKILSALLALIMMISIVPLSSITASAAASGKCGDCVTWVLDDFTGILTISGTGEMYDYNIDKPSWNSCVHDIKTVNINDGITTIGLYAFNNCKNLESVTIPNSVTVISCGAFSDCPSLTCVELGNGITQIEEWMFYRSGIKNITIPNSVTTIEGRAFSDCVDLESITFGTDLTRIGACAFSSCQSLTHIMLPNSVMVIEEYAFELCSNLTSIRLDNGVKTICYGAFSCCTALTDVYYSGTEEQWNTITIEEDNECLLNANLHFNYCEHQDSDGNGYCDDCEELLDPTVECNCNCHKSGITKFFFNFILFFQRLFGSNKECACGVAHY